MKTILQKIVTGKLSINEAAKLLGWPSELVAASMKSPLLQNEVLRLGKSGKN